MSGKRKREALLMGIKKLHRLHGEVNKPTNYWFKNFSTQDFPGIKFHLYNAVGMDVAELESRLVSEYEEFRDKYPTIVAVDPVLPLDYFRQYQGSETDVIDIMNKVEFIKIGNVEFLQIYAFYENKEVGEPTWNDEDVINKEQREEFKSDEKVSEELLGREESAIRRVIDKMYNKNLLIRGLTAKDDLGKKFSPLPVLWAYIANEQFRDLSLGSEIIDVIQNIYKKTSIDFLKTGYPILASEEDQILNELILYRQQEREEFELSQLQSLLNVLLYLKNKPVETGFRWSMQNVINGLKKRFVCVSGKGVREDTIVKSYLDALLAMGLLWQRGDHYYPVFLSSKQAIDGLIDYIDTELISEVGKIEDDEDRRIYIGLLNKLESKSDNLEDIKKILRNIRNNMRKEYEIYDEDSLKAAVKQFYWYLSTVAFMLGYIDYPKWCPYKINIEEYETPTPEDMKQILDIDVQVKLTSGIDKPETLLKNLIGKCLVLDGNDIIVMPLSFKLRNINKYVDYVRKEVKEVHADILKLKEKMEDEKFEVGCIFSELETIKEELDKLEKYNFGEPGLIFAGFDSLKKKGERVSKLDGKWDSLYGLFQDIEG